MALPAVETDLRGASQGPQTRVEAADPARGWTRGKVAFASSECCASGTRLQGDRSQRNSVHPPLPFLPLDTGSGPRCLRTSCAFGAREPKLRGDLAERLPEASQTQATLTHASLTHAALTALPDPADPQGSPPNPAGLFTPRNSDLVWPPPSHFWMEEPGTGLTGLVRPRSERLGRAGLGPTTAVSLLPERPALCPLLLGRWVRAERLGRQGKREGTQPSQDCVAVSVSERSWRPGDCSCEWGGVFVGI